MAEVTDRILHFVWILYVAIEILLLIVLIGAIFYLQIAESWLGMKMNYPAWTVQLVVLVVFLFNMFMVAVYYFIGKFLIQFTRRRKEEKKLAFPRAQT